MAIRRTVGKDWGYTKTDGGNWTVQGDIYRATLHMEIPSASGLSLDQETASTRIGITKQASSKRLRGTMPPQWLTSSRATSTSPKGQLLKPIEDTHDDVGPPAIVQKYIIDHAYHLIIQSCLRNLVMTRIGNLRKHHLKLLIAPIYHCFKVGLL